MSTRGARGFSLVTVLLALMLMAVAGSAAVTVGTMDVGTAQARANYQLALAAADAGLQHYATIARPSDVFQGQPLVGSRAGNAVENFVWLPGMDLDGDGTNEFESRYRAWGSHPPMGTAGFVQIEGQLLRNGDLVSTALIQVAIEARCDPNSNPQAGGSATGQGSATSSLCGRNPAGAQQGPPLIEGMN